MSTERDTRAVVDIGSVDAARRRGPVDRPSLGDDEEATLASLAWALLEGRWVIATALGIALLGATAYLLLSPPIYRSDVVVQVEDKTKTVAGLEDLSSAFGEKTPAETEMEIIRSRTLLGSVSDQLALDVSIAHARFPGIGGAVARRWHGEGPAPARLGLARYAWGGERVRFSRLEVSDELLGQELLLVALDGGKYRLEVEDGSLRLEGTVGVAAEGEGGGHRIATFVPELVARPGTRFHVTKRRRDDVVAELQEELRITEKGKKTGIVVIGLTGHSPSRIAAILDAVSATYLRQNVERKSAEAAKTLEFLETQLPLLKRNLDGAEAALNAFRSKKGTVDLTAETQAMLGRAVEVEKAISELDLQRSELRTRFTNEHPAIASLADKAEKLRAERHAIEAKLRLLPETELDSARLTRDVKVATELYFLLINKAQELRVVKSGTIGNVRILDQALLPYRPVSPSPAPVFAVALLLGLGAGVTLAFGRRAFHEGVDDPDEIEGRVGLPVYVAIPHSARQRALTRANQGADAARPEVLAKADPGDVAIENLRSLRTSLQFALIDAPNNVIAVGGPAPNVGKSFVCVNFAHVLAAAEHRVLLVDADLRRGRLHRYFGVDRSPGLSDLIGGSAAADRVISHTDVPGLDVLPTGSIPPNPAELLSSYRFQQILADLEQRYDLVVIDTPPVLAVTDPALVARHAGVNLLVLRAGQHSLREIALTLKRLAQTGVKVQGAILNDVASSGGRYGRHGRYQKYEYGAKE
jgi:tyrosine-protein kinase Etk/Wzc